MISPTHNCDVRFRARAIIAGGLAITVFLTAAAFSAEPQAPHVQAALDLLKTVRPDNTTYQHQGGEVHWQGDAGIAAAECKTDCSGFIDALIKRSYGLTDAQLKDWLKSKRPLAKHYHAAISAQQGFQNIVALKNALPGDLLAIQYPPGGKNTGHMMLVIDAPKKRVATAPLVEQTDQWEIGVIDVSESGHGTTDTRHHADKTSSPGLGRGVLRVYTNAAGGVAGYTWSTLKASNFQQQAAHDMVIGRIKPEFAQALHQ